MKVFLDTNILMEYFANRTKAADVKVISQAAYQGQIKACMSVGCLYTLIYLLGIYLIRGSMSLIRLCTIYPYPFT